MSSFANELRICARRLMKARGFAATVILMLAFAVGASTTIFSLIEGILLRPLPYRDPSRLVQLGEHVGNQPGIGATARDFDQYAQGGSAFASMGGYATTDFELNGGAIPEDISGARLTASVFSTLGVGPLLGRVFSRKEDGSHVPVAVIGYGLWTRRYHRDPHVLGQPIELNRRQYTIIGVMPRSFEFPLQAGRLNEAQLWVPMSLTPEELSDNQAGDWGFQMVARLKDGVTLDAAAKDAARVAQQIMRGFPSNMASIHIRGDAKLLSETITGATRPMLRVLFAAVMVVLLIACANVAILMLVRALRRHRDAAVRLALGARSTTIVRQTLLEGALLSIAGGLLGLTLAASALHAVLEILPDSIPRLGSVAIDPMIALFAVGVAMATGILSSLAPAIVALRTNLVTSLKDNARTGTAGSGYGRIRAALVITEIAVALLMLTASGALLRSYQKMLAVDPGFRPTHVLVVWYRLPEMQYATDESVETFNQETVDRLRSKPGVLSAAIGNTLPSSGFSGMAAYTAEGQSVEDWKLQFAGFGAVYGAYFKSLGIPLLEGRAFTAHDNAHAPLVVIVSKSMAEHCWPGNDAIGKRLHVGNPKKGLPWATVVGVVGNTRIGARDADGNDQFYIPALQPAILNGTSPTAKRTVPASGYVVMRAVLPPEQMERTLRETVTTIDPLLALDEVQPMRDVLSKTEAPRLLMTELIGAFTFAALLLAITGIYAVMSFSVSLRTQEIAIRMALGAQRGSIAGLVLRSGAALGLIGCIIGATGSLAVARLLRSYLFGVSATDPRVYAVSIALMLLCALVASFLPAARAAGTDPIKALRSAE